MSFGGIGRIPLFPLVERAVASILATGSVVAPVEVLISLQLLSAAHLEDWRRGQSAGRRTRMTATADPAKENS